MVRTTLRLSLAICLAVAGGCSSAPGNSDPVAAVEPVTLPSTASTTATYEEESMLHFLVGDGRFGMLVGLLEEESPGNFMYYFPRPVWPDTFFAATDQAFRSLSDEDATILLEDVALLTRVLRYHIAVGVHRAADLTPGTLRTVSGPVEVTEGSDGVRIAGAGIVEPDLEVDTGIVHAIDRLIVPCSDPVIRRSGVSCAGDSPS